MKRNFLLFDYCVQLLLLSALCVKKSYKIQSLQHFMKYIKKANTQLIKNNIRCTTFCWIESALNIRFNEQKKRF